MTPVLFALKSASMDQPITLPAPPKAEQRPYSYEAHGVTIEDPWHWLRPISRGHRPRHPRLSHCRKQLFRGLGEPAPGAARRAVRGDEGADQGGRQLGPAQGRRLSLLVGVHARRAIPHLVPQTGRWRRGSGHIRRTGRGRRQGLFPPGSARGQPRRQTARDPDRRQRVGALPSENPRPCYGQGHRDRNRGRDRPAGVDQRQRRDRVHRGQRELAQLPRAIPPARDGRRRKTSHSTRRPRSSAFRSASANRRTSG